MVTWGVLSVAMMFVEGKWSFYALRFALGVAEAGFLPGILYYLVAVVSRRPSAARAVSWFMLGIPLSTRVRRAARRHCCWASMAGMACRAGSGCSCSKGCRP